jgi:23S rRNA (uridine2552-2'-O)-methyltransferase
VVGPEGLVLGYDLEPPRAGGPAVHTHLADVHQLLPDRVRTDARAALGLAPDAPVAFDAVLSDMAPKTTGIRDTDQARSVGLVEEALALAEALLVADGRFVAKVFQGRGIDPLILTVRKVFSETKVLRPEATRQGSRELFIIGKGRRSS